MTSPEDVLVSAYYIGLTIPGKHSCPNKKRQESGIKYFYDVTDRVLFPSLDWAVLSF